MELLIRNQRVAGSNPAEGFRKSYILVVQDNSMQNYKVDESIVKEAKRKAEEDFSSIANMVSGTGSKQKYIESRTDFYIKKLLSQGK